MKIESNISKNFLFCFSEARGIAINKRKIAKNKSKKHLPYIETKLIIYIIINIIVLVSHYIFDLYCLPCFLACIANVYLIFNIIKIISVYYFRKKKSFKNTIMINKEGIIDESYYGIKMIFKWEKIIGVVIGDYTVTILTDTPCYFYFPITEKKDILEAIEKYGNNTIVIK